MAQATFKNNDELQGAVLEGIQENGSAKMIFVKDQGVYLMGATEGKAPEHILYVRGCDPSKNEDWYDKAYSYGGDDFGEYLTLPKDLVEHIMDGIVTKLVIKLTATSMSVSTFSKAA